MTFETVDAQGKPSGELFMDCNVNLPERLAFTFVLKHDNHEVEFKITPKVWNDLREAVGDVISGSKDSLPAS